MEKEKSSYIELFDKFVHAGIEGKFELADIITEQLDANRQGVLEAFLEWEGDCKDFFYNFPQFKSVFFFRTPIYPQSLKILWKIHIAKGSHQLTGSDAQTQYALYESPIASTLSLAIETMNPKDYPKFLNLLHTTTPQGLEKHVLQIQEIVSQSLEE